MAAKKKTGTKKPARRTSAPTKSAATRKPARASGGKSPGRSGASEVVYSDVLHELRKGLVSRLIR